MIVSTNNVLTLTCPQTPLNVISLTFLVDLTLLTQFFAKTRGVKLRKSIKIGLA